MESNQTVKAEMNQTLMDVWEWIKVMVIIKVGKMRMMMIGRGFEIQEN
jgi:hypothetical protein